MAYVRPNVYDIAYRHTVVRLLLIQVGLLVPATVIALYLKGVEFSLALLFGGAISILSSLIHYWRIRVATDEAAQNATLGLVELYKGVVLRFVIVIALLVLGMKWLGLEPTAIIIGFVVTHTGYFLARPVQTAKRRVENKISKN